MRSFVLFVALAGWVGWGAGAELACPRAQKPPLLDGKLDDQAWTRALRLADFTLPRSDQRPGKRVEAWLCFDSQALYVAFACDEPRPERIKAHSKTDDEDVWQDDCVEVWIRTTDSSLEFDQFIANTLGTRQSLRRRQTKQPTPWKPQWEAKVTKEAARWAVEMRIPLSDLDLAGPKAGDMLQLKVGREDHTGDEVVLSTWPAGSPYGAAEGFAPVYFEGANLLANPDMSEREGDRVRAWRFGEGDGRLFSSVVDGGRRVIRFEAPGRYSTAQQSLKLKPNASYRLAAEVKASAGIYLRARTSLRTGAPSTPYSAEAKPSGAYAACEVRFPTGPTDEALIIIGNTESGGKGEVLIADLRVVQEPAVGAFGSPIPVAPYPAEPTVVKKLIAADCRALKGFIGTPVDGTTQSRDWSGSVWEYNQRGAGAGVGYAYQGNDGLHISLADKGGFNAVLIEGGARVKLYRDCTSYDRPASGKLIAEFPGATARTRAWFEQPVRTDRVSFFDLADGRLADVSFFRVGRAVDGPAVTVRWSVAGAGKAGALDPWLQERFGKADRAAFELREGVGKSVSIEAAKGKAFHLVSQPLGEEMPLAAVGLDFVVDNAPTPVPFTLAVQDPLNPRSQLLGADFLLSKPGRCRVVLDFPDQVVAKGTPLWLSIRLDAAAVVRDVAIELLHVERARAVTEALAYRKLLLKAYFCSLSEARPWNGWYEDPHVAKSLGGQWGPQLKELLMTLEQCKQLGPKDGLVRQYDEWIWRGYRRRRKTLPPFEPRIDQAPGAPEWAVVVRQAWLTARGVPKWWIENRMVPTGEFGGEVGDDTDMYQNYADFPMFETDGVAALVKDGAGRLAELAEKQNLEQGLNRRTMDPLHAYEEGVNHEALMAWWNYGDPVCLERCMEAARSTEALTVLTPKGHRHFKSQDCGAADLRTDRKLGTDGHAHALMWHPTLEVAWYNRNPRAVKHLREWADGWLEHMEPGRYAAAVDVKTERVTETTEVPLYVGYGGQGSAFLFLYWITDDERYLKPFFEAFGRGSRRTSPELILPELIHRHGLGFLGPKLKELVVDEGAAATLVMGDKRPLIEALKRDIAELQRFPAMYTTTEPFTDRVFLYGVRNAAIAYTGGYASRNKLHHTHAASWEGFGTDYAALVLRAKRDALDVLVYNFADTPLSGRMRVWTLGHGEYQLRVGPDADGDDKMDRAERDERLEALRATAIPLTLPPKRLTVVECRQLRGLDDERLRPDLALSQREIRVEGGTVRGIAHNIGSKRVEAFEVALLDDSGKVRSRKTLGPLDAPLDLVAQRMPFALDGLPPGAKGWSVALDPEGRVAEIHEGNNRVPVPAE